MKRIQRAAGAVVGSAAARLVALIEARDWHLSTGFLGTPRLLPVLTDTGHTDIAYRLLTQRTRRRPGPCAAPAGTPPR